MADVSVARISSGGRVVIPAEFRRELDWSDGDEVFVALENGVVVLYSIDDAIREMQTLLDRHVPPGVSLADELIADRRAEAHDD